MNTTFLKMFFFDFNKYNLSFRVKKEIENIYNNLLKNNNYIIEIYGHTDNIGNDNFNTNLSQNRANVVMKYLLDLGKVKNRIKVFGYGKSKLFLPNTSKNNRNMNRRVEFKIIKK